MPEPTNDSRSPSLERRRLNGTPARSPPQFPWQFPHRIVPRPLARSNRVSGQIRLEISGNRPRPAQPPPTLNDALITEACDLIRDLIRQTRNVENLLRNIDLNRPPTQSPPDPPIQLNLQQLPDE